MQEILVTEQLTHTYSADTPFEHKALQGIDFSLHAGEFVGIIGHTGSGKSTFIQHLNGLLSPTEGKMRYEGIDIAEDKAKRRQLRFSVGLVFQYPEYQLFEETVEADIAFGPKNMGLSKEDIAKRVAYAAKLVGLSEHQLKKSPFALSGGQKRRAAIAGVLAMYPKVLILDEPTAGLDPQGKREILRHIKAYQKEKNAAVIMVSHSMEDIASMADRILVFAKGSLVLEGSPSEIFSKVKMLREIGLDIPEAAEIASYLRERGLSLPTDIFTVEALAAHLANCGKHRGDNLC